MQRTSRNGQYYILTQQDFLVVDATAVNLRTPTKTKPISAKLPNSTKVCTTHECKLAMSQLTARARKAYILPGLASYSLLSVVKLCNARCEVSFDKIRCRLPTEDVQYSRDKNAPDLAYGWSNYRKDTFAEQLTEYQYANARIRRIRRIVHILPSTFMLAPNIYAFEGHQKQSTFNFPGLNLRPHQQASSSINCNQ
ncbi:hypothetical protein ACHAWF_009117 [Thalassiosira exigua]